MNTSRTLEGTKIEPYIFSLIEFSQSKFSFSQIKLVWFTWLLDKEYQVQIILC
jgi:hypothetical protein